MEAATMTTERPVPGSQQWTPARSDDQRREALRKANRIRSHRAALKPQVKSGERPWIDLLDDPNCATMKIVDLLVHLPKVGRVKANKALRRARVSPSKTLAGLSERQRGELARILGVAPVP